MHYSAYSESGGVKFGRLNKASNHQNENPAVELRDELEEEQSYSASQ